MKECKDYVRIEKPNKINQSFDVNFVLLNVYVNYKKSNSIRLS